MAISSKQAIEKYEENIIYKHNIKLKIFKHNMLKKKEKTYAVARWNPKTAKTTSFFKCFFHNFF
jgi:hypothetical protein